MKLKLFICLILLYTLTPHALLASVPAASGQASGGAVYQGVFELTDGKTVAAVTGSVPDGFEIMGTQTVINCYDDITGAVSALKSGGADYALTSLTRAEAIVYGDGTLEIVPDVTVTDEGASIGVSKEKPELTGKINAAIDKLRDGGTLEDLRQRWIRFDGEYAAAAIPENTQGDELRAAFSPTGEPMNFTDSHGEFTGFDADLARHIAHELGMKITFIEVDFPLLVDSVASGKADIAISNMAATRQRRARIDFTQDYFSNPLVLLRLKPALTKDSPAQTQGKNESGVAISFLFAVSVFFTVNFSSRSLRLLREEFAKQDKNMFDAALTEGCSRFRFFFCVTFPIAFRKILPYFLRGLVLLVLFYISGRIDFAHRGV